MIELGNGDFDNKEEPSVAALDRVCNALKAVLDEYGIDSTVGSFEPDVDRLTINFIERGHDLESGADPFEFSGLLLSAAPAHFESVCPAPIAAIKQLTVPEVFRGRTIRRTKLGTRLVLAWESSWGQAGIHSFMAHIPLKGSLPFWADLGYRHLDLPYESRPNHMYKVTS